MSDTYRARYIRLRSLLFVPETARAFARAAISALFNEKYNSPEYMTYLISFKKAEILSIASESWDMEVA